MTNEAGVYPTEFKVLIKPVEVEERTKGGIIIPDQTKDRDQFAQMEGILVAVSPLAFSYADTEEWVERMPAVGDRVLFAKYAGAVVKGRDGKDYRIVQDKDICAVLA